MKRKVWFFVGGGLLLILLASFLFSGFFLKITGQPFLDFNRDGDGIFGNRGGGESTGFSGDFITDRTYVSWTDDSGNEISEYIYLGEEGSVIAKVGGLNSEVNGEKAIFNFYSISGVYVGTSEDGFISSGTASAWFDINEEVMEKVGDGRSVKIEIIINEKSEVFEPKKDQLILRYWQEDTTSFLAGVDAYWSKDYGIERITNITYVGKNEVIFAFIDGANSDLIGKTAYFYFYKNIGDSYEKESFGKMSVQISNTKVGVTFSISGDMMDRIGDESIYFEVVIDGQSKIFDSAEDKVYIKNEGPDSCAILPTSVKKCTLGEGQYAQSIGIKELSGNKVKLISGNEESGFLSVGNSYVFPHYYGGYVEITSISSTSVSFLFLRKFSSNSNCRKLNVSSVSKDIESCYLFAKSDDLKYSLEDFNYIPKLSSFDGEDYSFKIKNGDELSDSLNTSTLYMFGNGEVIYVKEVTLYLREDSGNFEILPRVYFDKTVFESPSGSNFNFRSFFARGFWGFWAHGFEKRSNFAEYNTYFSDGNIPDNLNPETVFFSSIGPIRNKYEEGIDSYAGDLFWNFFAKDYSNFNEAYFIVDEAPWLGTSYSSVEAKYDFFDKYVPDAPTWINFAFVENCSEDNCPGEEKKSGDLKRYKKKLKLFGDRADIVGFDYYGSFDWVEKSSWGSEYFVIDNHGIDATGEYMEIFNDVFPNKPIWFIAQGYQELERSESIVKRDIRFMPYQALIHGADGIIFFGLHLNPDVRIKGEESDKKVSRGEFVYPILKELEEIERYLTNGPIKKVVAPLDSKYNLVEPFDGIEYAVFGGGSDFVVIIANRKQSSVSKTFDAEDLGIDLNVMEKFYDFNYQFSDGVYYLESNGLEREEREILVQNGELKLDFNPYQVYVLRSQAGSDNSGRGGEDYTPNTDIVNRIKKFFGVRNI